METNQQKSYEELNTIWVFETDTFEEPSLLEKSSKDEIWASAKKVKKGDFVLMIRHVPTLEWAYVFQAITDAYSAENSQYSHLVKIRKIYALEKPISVEELVTVNSLRSWSLVENANNFREHEDLRSQNVLSEFIDYAIDKEPALFEIFSVLIDKGFESIRVKIIDDTPAKTDLLGRQSIAIALANWIVSHQAKKLKNENSFALNIYGKWGSGKSSFLLQLESAIRSNPKEQNWIIVPFNAWLHSRTNPAWWALFSNIKRYSLQTLSPFRSLFLRYKYFFKELIHGYGLVILTALTLTLLAITSIQLKLWDPASETGNKNLTNIIAISGLGFSLLLTIFQMFMSGTARYAQLFQQLAKDPMEAIKSSISGFCKDVDRPILVMVDDLDRCNREFTIELLESLQTKFNHSSLFFVVAADRNWLSKCYSKMQCDELDNVEKISLTSGHIFMEKIFQLSIGLPPISDDFKTHYVDRLFKKEIDHASLFEMVQEDIKVSTSEKVKVATSERELNELIPNEFNSYAEKVLWTNEALKQASQEDFDIKRSQRLARFVNLMESNPRSIKLLFNVYGIFVNFVRASGNLKLSENDLDQIALWAILSLRFPAIKDYLEDHCEDLELIKNMEQKPKRMPDYLWDLSISETVQSIIWGRGVSIKSNQEDSISLTDSGLKIILGKT